MSMPESAEAQNPELRVSRSPEYRTLFTNIFGMVFGDNDVQIVFGLNPDPGRPQIVEEQSRIIMTPRSAKLLAHTLSETIKKFEKENGEIVVPGDKLEALTDAITAHAKPAD